MRPTSITLPRPPRTTSAHRRHAAPPSWYDALLRAWAWAVPLALVLLGAAIRVRQWAVGRSLWLDEALVGESIVTRDYTALVSEPLLHNQAAPVLWLWAERLTVDLFGTDERALRLVPLLAGIGVLVATWALARQLLPQVLTPVPVALVALSPSLGYYSNEVKQYSTDALVVVVLVILGVRALRAERSVVVLGLAGAVAVWASHASVLALAGISAVVVLAAAADRDWGRAARSVGWLSPWLVSLGAAYVLLLHDLRDSSVLKDFWAYTFPQDQGLPDWFLGRWLDLAETPLTLSRPPLALLILLFGAVHLAWLARARGAVLLAPVPMALIAAGLSAYPFAGRLSLWLVPLASVALAAALPTRLDLPRAGWLLAAVAALTTVVGPSARVAVERLGAPLYVEELGPVMEQLARERRPGDLLLVNVAARGGYDYYSRFIPSTYDGSILLFTPPAGGCDDRVALRAGRFATERVWVLFSHELSDGARLGTNADLIARIQTVSSLSRTISAPGARALLFDPTAGPQAVQPDVVRNAARCLGVFRATRS